MTAPKNPAVFRLRNTDGILARHGELLIGVGYGDLENEKLTAVFERNDEQVEAAAADRGYPGYWISPEEARELRARQDRFLACEPGHYPWDEWKREAIAAGVSDELASLGRAVMREAHQHAWCEELKDECGVDREDNGKGLIYEALEQPDWAVSRWNWLLVTDGLRFDPWTRAESNPLDLEWTPLRQQWEDETYPLADPTSEAALRRDAYRYLEEFFELDQLQVIGLNDEAFHRGKDHTTYFAEFVIIGSKSDERYLPRALHSGVIQNRYDPELSSFMTDIYKQVQEGDQFDD